MLLTEMDKKKTKLRKTWLKVFLKQTNNGDVKKQIKSWLHFKSGW